MTTVPSLQSAGTVDIGPLFIRISSQLQNYEVRWIAEAQSAQYACEQSRALPRCSCSSLKVRVKKLPEGVFGREVLAPLVLNISSRWLWLGSFTLRPLYPTGLALGTLEMGGCAGPRSRTDGMAKGVIPCPYRQSKHDSSIVGTAPTELRAPVPAAREHDTVYAAEAIQPNDYRAVALQCRK
jgi:hypothetical protein